MLEFQYIFMTQVFLFGLMLVGVITAKTGIIDGRSRSSLSDLVINVLLPCNILVSFVGTDRSQIPAQGIMLLISVGALVFCFTLSKYVLYRRSSSEQKKVLIYATLISNAVLLGNPVVESIYGLKTLPLMAVYMLPLRMAALTWGLIIFAGGKGNMKSVIFHPCMVATYLGILVMITGFTPPALATRLLFSLGNCTTPLSMIVVGNILVGVDYRKLFSKLTVYFTFIRLVVIPLAIMGILFLLRLDPMVSSIAVILNGMPAGVTTSIFADKYGADKELAAKIVFASTLLSVITIPALALLLQIVF